MKYDTGQGDSKDQRPYEFALLLERPHVCPLPRRLDIQLALVDHQNEALDQDGLYRSPNRFIRVLILFVLFVDLLLLFVRRLLSDSRNDRTVS